MGVVPLEGFRATQLATPAGESAKRGSRDTAVAGACLVETLKLSLDACAPTS